MHQQHAAVTATAMRPPARICTASLKKGQEDETVPPSLRIHAGSLHGNRLAMRKHKDGTFQGDVFIATGVNALHRVKVSMPSDDVVGKPSKNANVPFPVPLKSLQYEHIFSTPTATDEIMEVRFDGREGGRLGCVDARGRVFMFRGLDEMLPPGPENGEDLAESMEPDAKRIKLSESELQALLAPSLSIGAIYDHGNSLSNALDLPQFESGWAGLALHPSDSTRFATARFFHRDLTLFNGDRPERVVQLVQNPTQVKYISVSESHSPLLAVTEHNQLSMWDMRVNSSDASSCVARLGKSRGQLYDVTSSCATNGNASTLVAVAGVDRSVNLFDSKRWTNRHTWQNCLKYSVSHLHFSQNTREDNLIFACGFDNGELNIGNYVKNSKRSWSGMQADSRWVGMDEDSNDVIAGFTANASVYVIENPHSMHLESPK